MTNNCFVRTIKAVIDNDELPRINTLNISINGEGLFHFRLDGIKNVEVKGDGYFTDSTDTENYGKTLEINGGTVYVHVTSTANLLVYGMNDASGVLNLEQDTTALNKKLSFNIMECMQNDINYTNLNINNGNVSKGAGLACYGDITDLEIRANKLSLSGCNKLSGSMDKVIRENAGKDNLYEVWFNATNLTFNTASLEGKNKLYIITSNNETAGDVKYFGDTRNRYINTSGDLSNNLTGTVEQMVARLITQGRTGDGDYFVFPISSSYYSHVTYLGVSLKQYYLDYIAEHPSESGTKYMEFHWNSQGITDYEIKESRRSPGAVPL